MELSEEETAKSKELMKKVKKKKYISSMGQRVALEVEVPGEGRRLGWVAVVSSVFRGV